MTTQPSSKETVAPTRIGEHAAMQPVSGIKSVNETFAVHGLGRGGFVRHEDTEREKAHV